MQTLTSSTLSSNMLEQLTPYVKDGGGNVMAWGCFGGGEVEDLYSVIIAASTVTRSKP